MTKTSKKAAGHLKLLPSLMHLHPSSFLFFFLGLFSTLLPVAGYKFSTFLHLYFLALFLIVSLNLGVYQYYICRRLKISHKLMTSLIQQETILQIIFILPSFSFLDNILFPVSIREIKLIFHFGYYTIVLYFWCFSFRV